MYMFQFINIAQAAEEGGEGISVHLAPYVLGHVGNMPITSTLLTSWLVMLLLIVGAFLLNRSLKTIPGKSQSIIELTIGGLYNYVVETLESEKLAKKYFPVLITIFIFLLTMNWVGLLPGVTSIGYFNEHGHLIPFLYPPATDLNIPIAFAFISMAVIEFAGIVALGAWKYGGKFINFSSPMSFVVGLIELISEIGRIVSFSFRLFGNIFAGKTLLLVAMFFVPLILPVPILLYETFVGMIQAGVFAFLTLIFIKLAVAEPH